MRRMVLIGESGIRIEAEVAESRRERMRGLLRRERLPPGRALLLPNARSVHTVGMRFPIDVAFLDADLMVLAVKPLAPGRLCLPRRRARHVLECAAGTGLGPGERLHAAQLRTNGEGGPGFSLYSSLPPGGAMGGAAFSAPIV